MALLQLILCFSFVHAAFAAGSPLQVQCTEKTMKITVPMDGKRTVAYLNQLKHYAPCQPIIESTTAVFTLDLHDFHKCGVARVVNSLTSKWTFYHKVVIESDQGGKETVTAGCVAIIISDVTQNAEPFPADFKESNVLNITPYVEGRDLGPMPGAVVKLNGEPVSGETAIILGTPMSMEIYLDSTSAAVYGLRIDNMLANDTGDEQEIIVHDSCSLDPYLYENFLTTDGDTLTAKFKAFKFPDTTYVQFRSTGSICLDKCYGVECSNGVTGYGRKRRSYEIGLSTKGAKVIEFSISTIIKVNVDKKTEEALDLLKNIKAANQLLAE